jgi:hypothetical protein
MESAGVRKLARALRVMVIVMFACNLIALLFVPFFVSLKSANISLASVGSDLLYGGDFFFDYVSPGGWWLVLYGFLFLTSFAEVWAESYTAVLTVFLWACGVCTAVILWQAKRVLDGILKGKIFTFANAVNMRRAAVCCFAISGAALVRTVWGLVYYRSALPLLSYNFLFVPVFLMAGLVCMVLSALFRQAAELKSENDLTI